MGTILTKTISSSQHHHNLKHLTIPWKVRLFLSIFPFLVDLSCHSNHTINRTLLNFVDLKSSPNPKTTKDITINPITNLWFRLFLPQNHHRFNTSTTTLPIVIYFHGGGFICCSANSKPYHDLCVRLANELSVVVVSVNYRLAPEFKFPAQYEDAVNVLEFLVENCEDVLPNNVDLGKIFIAGDSAGANIAHHLAMKVSNGYEFKLEINVLGVMAIQAFFQTEERTESEMELTNVPVVNMKRVDWSCKAFLPQGADKDHPSLNVFKELREGEFNYPATIVVVGGFDPLKDGQKMFYRELKRSGKEVYLVEYDYAFHSFYGFPEVPESALLVEDLRHFMKKQLEKLD